MSALITAPELLRRLPTEQALRIVDCRFSLSDKEKGERDYQVAHIPRAVYAHLERDLSAPHHHGLTGRHPLPDPSELSATLSRWGIGPETDVVAYDDAGGAFAARLWWLLRYFGHSRVQVLDGGIESFVRAGGVLSSQIAGLKWWPFRASLQPHMVAGLSEVEERVQSGNARLFDARAPDRFRGENEAIDPVAGHIPGAKSLPFSGNLENGRFLTSQDQRARLLRAMGSERDVADSIVYCGSGVTACHLVLGAAHAGLPLPRLYPGSYSEWICDPARPVARGE